MSPEPKAPAEPAMRINAARDAARKTAQILDARVVIARRDLQELEAQHREAIGALRALDDLARETAPQQPRKEDVTPPPSS